MLTQAQKDALEVFAKAFGWDRRPIEEMQIIMWAAFHYYVMRLRSHHGEP